MYGGAKQKPKNFYDRKLGERSHNQKTPSKVLKLPDYQHHSATFIVWYPYPVNLESSP